MGPLLPVMFKPSYCVLRVVPSISKIDVLEPPRTSAATDSTPGLLPGESTPNMVTAPPIAPEPPSVAPASTCTAPLACVPSMKSEPAVTVVVPA